MESNCEVNDVQNGDELLNYFQKEINAEVEKEITEIEAETKRLREEAYAKLEATSQREANEKAEKEINELVLANAKEISRMQTKINKQLISKRQELQNAIFDACKKKLVEFTQTKAYQEWVNQKIAKIDASMLDGQTEISFSQRDQQLAKQCANQLGKKVELKFNDEIQIGGFILVNYAKSIVLDESLDNRLAEQEEWFYNHSGLMIK